MTSDRENDEIKDSSFPVEFNDETVSLDLYGVWVKKGPRNVPEVSPKQSNITSENEIDDSFYTLSELADFGDLPDLKATSEEIIPEEVTDIETQFAVTTSSVEISQITTDFNFVDIENIDDFFSQNETTMDSSEDSAEVSEFADTKIETTEYKTSEYETPENDNPEVSTIQYEIPEDVDFSPEEFMIEEVTQKTLNIPKIKIVETSEFTSNNTLPSDDDFSSFLDDLNAGEIVDSSSTSPLNVNSSVSDSIDLDSFIDSFNETGGTSQDETQKVFDDLEPVDLVLEFDESFLADAEKIRATGSSVSESEFFNSEFGVEMIDETTQMATSGDLDTQIDTLKDINRSALVLPEFVQKTTPISSIIDSNEFDDLLLSLDAAPSPVQSKSDQSLHELKKNIYSLSVKDEDGFEALQPSTTESVSNDDITVSLFSSSKSEMNNTTVNEQMKVEPAIMQFEEKKSENELINGLNISEIRNETPFIEEILDIPDIRDYNDTESSHDTENTVTTYMEDSVAFDFDDISAVEQELSDMTPDTGDDAVVTNDKSTELLMIIADELSSIKKEITTLKSELSAFKTAGISTEPVIQEETEISVDNSGFFSDDDTDETIALTGDELNNILITADFTEEKNDDAVENVETESKIEDDFSLSEISDSSIIEKVEENASENIVDFVPPLMSPDLLADEHDIPETLPESIFDIGESSDNDTNKVEISHITTIEDDTSYLEGTEIAEPELDNITIEEPELETIDFNDEKLEEPELAEFNIDLTEIETDFPVSQDVPVESPIFEEPVIAEAVNVESVIETVECSPQSTSSELSKLPFELKNEIKSVLSYMDQLLESLPEEKIEEFARSEHFEVYKKLFEELGIS